MQTAERRVIVKHENLMSLFSFQSLQKNLGRNYDYLKEWTKYISEDFIILELREQSFLIPKYRIRISKEVRITLVVYGARVANIF